MAELVDNAIEAEATRVDIVIRKSPEIDGAREYPITVFVVDDGTGMSPSILQSALQLGGSTRFGARNGLGRYGMGLPNSSLSQAKRVNVLTWTSRNSVWQTHLDIDEITAGDQSEVSKPVRTRLRKDERCNYSESGTIVAWSKCDRLSSSRVKILENNLHRNLGQMFRKFIWKGCSIRVNGTAVRSIDPMYRRNGVNLVGAEEYGEKLEFRVKCDDTYTDQAVSVITVRFVELPIGKWHSLTNAEKRKHRISKGAGVSVLRAGREIDYGWFFMGGKRRENYDDWWRCEITFKPELDELFGVSHTKQGIRPRDQLKEILVPEIEAIAHKLNGRVREKFSRMKSKKDLPSAAKRAGLIDPRIAPPKRSRKGLRDNGAPLFRPVRSSSVPGMQYSVKSKRLSTESFFVPQYDKKQLTLTFNADHAFFDQIYLPLHEEEIVRSSEQRAYIELLLLSVSRAESLLKRKYNADCAEEIRVLWGSVLESYLA